MRNGWFHRVGWVLLAAIVVAMPVRALAAEAPVPDELKGIGVDEKPGAVLPLELTFKDELGKTVALGDYFKGNRPVILQLGYFGCPMLCGLVSQGMVKSLKDVSLDMGTDYEVIYLSVNPKETSDLACRKKTNFVKEYGRAGAGAGWHFLVGQEKDIQRVADTVGFRYKFVPEQQQYAHPAVLTVLTPDGHVSRYLYGVEYLPQTVRLSLVEASAGKIGSTTDHILMTCLLQYDAASHKYVVAAERLMKTAGVLTVLVMGLVLWWLFRRYPDRPDEADASAKPMG